MSTAMSLLKLLTTVFCLSLNVVLVRGCECENYNIEPCPIGCVAAQCNMREAVCTCNTDCDAQTCSEGYVMTNQNVCDEVNTMETCQKAEPTFNYCDECLPGYFGYKCEQCGACPAGEVCMDGLNGSGQCMAPENMPVTPTTPTEATQLPTPQQTPQVTSAVTEQATQEEIVVPTQAVTQPSNPQETAESELTSDSSTTTTNIPFKETIEPVEATTEDLGATDDSGGNGMSSGSMGFIVGGAAVGGLAFLGIGVYGFIWYRNHKGIVAAPDIMA